jgi:PqqD family protein of HPr-rel-A system
MPEPQARPTDVPERPAWAFTLDMGDEVVLFDERTGVLHALDERASLLWRCFDGDVSIEALSEEVADAFGVDPGDVRRDIVALVDQLAEMGLLLGTDHPVEAPAGAPPGEEVAAVLADPPDP